ncbi:SGNH/GDSL hydrolase family protein [Cohnella yongneupensis]|uniref:SGNH/GDSL hydrolase family protein n=1 Tax=Cohnella yongneupensis TaxID=425006 RepID=A0ABW0QVC3_9BACL
MAGGKKAFVFEDHSQERRCYVKEEGEIGMELKWHTPHDQPFHVAGFAWFEQDRIYRRLPQNPSHALPEAVDYLANNTAGGQIRFQTDSSKLSIKVKLDGKADMNHMPATGQCGYDCYIGMPGEQTFYSTAKYDHSKEEYEVDLFERYDGGLRNITLYFPLYRGVKEILIGLDQGAALVSPPPYDSNKRIVIYGTSITQGGCASRSGMAYPNILSRKINWEFINLGFSGSGKGEAEVARVIGEIPDPALFVLDYEANCVSPELFATTLPEFIRIYRSMHPEVPILVLSQIRFGQELLERAQLDMRLTRRKIQIDTVREFREQGDNHLFFYDGESLLGSDFAECTVDGVHPTDLGFWRMADHLEPVLRTYL